MSSFPVSACLSTVERINREVWFRRGLIVISAISVMALVCGFALMLWSENEFGPPESIVAAQSTMLAQDGTLYYDLNHYPYTVCAYTPMFYLLEAGLIRTGMPVLTAGRLLSFTALLGIVGLSWRILMLYTGNRYCAGAGMLLCASTSLLLKWGTTAQVDTLALCFALAAFYQFSRHAMLAENRLVWAIMFALLAFFTKQTMLACPAALVTLLCVRNRRLGLRFAVCIGAVALGLVLGLNAVLGGRFLADIFWANLNPFAIGKINQHILFLAIGAGQLILLTWVGARRVWSGRGRELLVYLGLAFTVLALTAPKIGSDSNYQMETSVLLVLCACLSLHSLNFFQACFRGSKTWITLLQLPLAVHLILNVRITKDLMLTRIESEQRFRTQVAKLRSYLSDGGRILSTESNALVRLRRRIEVEPLIYGILVGAGRIDPEPLRRDIEASAFSTVILLEDLARPLDPNPEIASLLPAHRAEIQRHYRLIAHIPGPYLEGIYVYKPVAGR